MKDLTYKELENAPSIVKFLYLRAMAKEPVGSSMIEEAIKDYPEYFPDELEHRRKWVLIPQQVHDDYWKEREILRTEMYKEMPPSKGILGWINDPKGYEGWNIAYEKCRKTEAPLAAALHKKFYSQYGIEWNGW